MAPTQGVKTITTNVGWSVLSKTATFGLKFVTVPILARLLTPEDFGTVAVALTVVQFLAMIGGAGLTSALIVDRDSGMDTVHTVFWANLAMSLIMSVILFLGANGIGSWMGAAQSADLLRIMAFLIPLQLTADVAYSLLAREMNFSKDAILSTVSETTAALVALALAFMGFGIWALVVQLFSSAVIRLVGLYSITRYVPRFVIKPDRMGPLVRYSSGLMGSEIANFVTFQAPMVVIARMLTLADAGAYSAANRFASIPNQVVLSAVMGVLFPAFSLMGDDRKRRTDALMLSTQVMTVVLAPAMFGLWAVAEPAMLVLFGPQWAYAWPVLGLLALSKAIVTPCSTFIPYLKGTGQSRVLFWSAVLRAVATTLAIILGATYGNLVDAMVALCVVNAITLVGYSWAVFRVDGIPFFWGLMTSSRSMLTSLVMGVGVRLTLSIFEAQLTSPYLQLLVGAVVGGVLYGAMFLVTERALVKKIIGMVKRRRGGSVADAPPA
ncbi:succinoglycan biosynthesis protein exop [Rhizobium sp. Leaf321]|uniref:lipopolysaccharide biosynthesis protein n=1 Tax=Rhizobium sp. Leaf321 TaxID=1736335 RepID=UPI0007135CD0|nr:lipopolysaccharide biosynthesis protein [Rhizobium sp. Leaf321]KQQ70683.1 succinoglycan biosynthesis protein exop [Rhizobium sp. Leaf321]